MHTYIQSAWSFASSLLWRNHDLTDEEIREALRNLYDYFNEAKDLLEAFKTFCARVIIAAQKVKTCPILHPRIWLDPTCIKGLTAPKARDKDLKRARRKTPTFDEGVSTIATHFLDYTQQPSTAIFQTCTDTLKTLNLPTWIQYLLEATHTPHLA